MIVLLLFVIAFLSIAVFILYHHHLVNQSGMHQALRLDLAKAQADAAEALAWVRVHVMHTHSVAAVEALKPGTGAAPSTGA